MTDDTFFNFIKRGQRTSDIFIKHREVTQGGTWTEWESLCRIMEEVGELEKSHRKHEPDMRILEEASDIILATIAHLNREGFDTRQIQNALTNTLIKVEERAKEKQKEIISYMKHWSINSNLEDVGMMAKELTELHIALDRFRDEHWHPQTSRSTSK